MLKKSFLLVFILFSIQPVFAQNKGRAAKYYSFGAHLIGSYFWGDLYSNVKTVRSGVGLQYLHKTTEHASITVDLNYIRLVADDAEANVKKPKYSPEYIRNLHMRNDVIEFAIHGRYELLPCMDYFTKRKKMNAFGTIGLGVLYTNPQAKDSSGTWRNLRHIQTENRSYGAFTAYIPVSVGVQFKLTGHLDLELELGYRFSFTDYLDDAKGKYVETTALPNGDARYLSNRSAEEYDAFTGKSRNMEYITHDLGYPVLTTSDGYSYVASTAPGQQRGTRFGLDGYFVGMVRIVYIIPRKG
ncbi:hypothetical protein CHU_2403 [Cytophaga hutchinsonii ATCC 33406]|uniref:DUF6089 domain-containing protein n=1 Tax=Cytophaga hutchinsonii (strain ATCC 33406 / DSM 1761 / CIP 103989 / NBRC 15051 / NCIMB 9469 / D465) TaxID=269798 RepID=A0A6N4STF8_CYTH3|nr:hypothetical protein CHU_2403 [Cytophaga hutchinsonii ATCC 33406]SFX66420.1 hypothetical protein SAMN04487930_107130 [Cytophaga hutchinsonii ATCC 33406]